MKEEEKYTKQAEKLYDSAMSRDWGKSEHTYTADFIREGMTKFAAAFAIQQVQKFKEDKLKEFPTDIEINQKALEKHPITHKELGGVLRTEFIVTAKSIRDHIKKLLNNH